MKVTASDGSPVPFTLRGQRAANSSPALPGSVRVLAGDREYLYSLTLPQLWDTRWEPPPEARQRHPAIPHGVAKLRPICGPGWRWRAARGLVAEWLLYGRFRRTARRFLAPLVPLRIGLAFRRRTRQPLGVRR